MTTILIKETTLILQFVTCFVLGYFSRALHLLMKEASKKRKDWRDYNTNQKEV